VVCAVLVAVVVSDTAHLLRSPQAASPMIRRGCDEMTVLRPFLRMGR
jgi:hypothetical protein